MIEFDHNADDQADGTVMSDQAGNFAYTPYGLTDGPVTIRARVAEWDAESMAYRYGDWASFSFTLDTASQAEEWLSSPELGSGGDGFEQGVDATLSAAEAALQAAGVLGGATLDDYLWMGDAEGTVCPFTYYYYARPTSANHSSTVTVSQTTPTSGGESSIESSAAVSYVMAVTGDDTSGTFTLDIVIDASLAYSESGTSGSGDNTANAAESVPGAYLFTIHATGSYTATESGGPYTVLADYTLQEDRSFDMFEDASGTASDDGVTAASDDYGQGQASSARVETGSFGAEGVSGTYILAYGYHWSDTSAPTATDPDPNAADGGVGLVSWSGSAYRMSYVEIGTRTGSTASGRFSYREYASGYSGFTLEGGDGDPADDSSSGSWIAASSNSSAWSLVTIDGTFDGEHTEGTYLVSESAHYDSSLTCGGWMLNTPAEAQEGLGYSGSYWACSGSNLTLSSNESGAFDDAVTTSGTFESSLSATSYEGLCSGMTMTSTSEGGDWASVSYTASDYSRVTIEATDSGILRPDGPSGVSLLTILTVDESSYVAGSSGEMTMPADAPPSAPGIASIDFSFGTVETSSSRDTLWHVECVSYSPTSQSGLYSTESNAYSDWSSSTWDEMTMDWSGTFTDGHEWGEAGMGSLVEGSGWAKSSDSEWGVLGNSGVTGTYRVIEEGHEEYSLQWNYESDVWSHMANDFSDCTSHTSEYAFEYDFGDSYYFGTETGVFGTGAAEAGESGESTDGTESTRSVGAYQWMAKSYDAYHYAGISHIHTDGTSDSGGIVGYSVGNTSSVYEGIGEFRTRESDAGTFSPEGDTGAAHSESSGVEVSFYHMDSTNVGTGFGPGYAAGGTIESVYDDYSKSHSESSSWSVYDPAGTASGSHTESSSGTRTGSELTNHQWRLDLQGMHTWDSSSGYHTSTHDSSAVTATSSASGSMSSSTVVHQETSGDPPTVTADTTTTSSSTTGTPPTAPEFLDEDDDEGDGDANEDWAGEGEWSAPEGDADGPYVWEPGTEGGYNWRGPGPRGDEPTEDFSPDPLLPDWQTLQDLLAPLAEEAHENPESLPQYTDAALAALGAMEDPQHPTQPAVQAVVGEGEGGEGEDGAESNGTTWMDSIWGPPDANTDPVGYFRWYAFPVPPAVRIFGQAGASSRGAVPDTKTYSNYGHYGRNRLNENPPYDYAEKHWTKMPDWANRYHRFGLAGEKVEKFLSPDGHCEAVYVNGILDWSQTNGGTYNYASPTDEPIWHFVLDMLPYYFWGNGPDDKTLWIGERIYGTPNRLPSLPPWDGLGWGGPIGP